MKQRMGIGRDSVWPAIGQRWGDIHESHLSHMRNFHYAIFQNTKGGEDFLTFTVFQDC